MLSTQRALMTAIAVAVAAPALAQTPAAQPPAGAAAAPRPAPAAVGGPVIPGLCVYNNAGAISTSTVGRYLVQRLTAIQNEAETELRTEGAALDTERRTLETQQATIAPAQLQQRATALQTRIAAFQRKAELRNREVRATEQKALQRVGTDLDPILRQVYAARGCGVLVDQQSVFLANPATDITQQVVTALNGRLTTFPINRERLPETPAPAAATGSRSLQATPAPAATTPPAATPRR
jgi:outer membrane protein